MSATSISCSTEESTCFTRVRYEAGSLRSTKGCILKQDCQDYLANNAEGCSRGIVSSGICSYCCEDPDHCNYDRFPYSDTTPAPTTTTPMPISAVTIPHSGMPCNSSTAEDSLNACMAQYRGQVAWTLQNSLERFGEFCRHVPDVLHCVATSLEDCICLNDAANPVTILTPALKLLAAQCPSQCNQTAGLQCIQHSQSRILNIMTGSSDFSCGVLYKEVTSGFQCVHFSVSSCSHSTFVSYNVTQSYSHSAIEKLCPMSTPSTFHAGVTLPTSGRIVQTRFPPEGSTASPVVSSTRTTDVPATEDPRCNIEAVNDCLAGLGHAVVQARVEGLSFDNICQQLLPATSLCLLTHSDACSTELKQRFQFAKDYIDGLMGAECLVTTPAPVCDPTRARLCVVRQWELIEGDYSIQEACDAVANTTECVRYNSQDCTIEEKSSLNTTLYNVLELLGDKCVKDAAQCNNETIIELEEGGSAHDIEFQFKKLSISLCDEPDCEVVLKLEAESQDTNPKCLNGQRIPQFVIGRPHGSGSACKEVITSGNWRDVRKYKISAKTDLKLDGNSEQKLRIVVKKVVGGQVVESNILCVYTVRVIDKDAPTVPSCTIWNDPHIRSFAKLRYNMHTEGWYQMYRHKTHPIEVQVGYQKCSSRATCICAAAIRAGDTVYVMDRCKRNGVTKCNRCKNQLINAQLFFHKEITPGFRMFMSEAGTRMDIQLPHGTVVTLKESNNFFNVVVNPSSADYLATRGLCGIYGEEHTYFLPNGTEIYPKRSPSWKVFFQSWRIPDEDLLVNGVARGPFRLPADYCDCLQGDDTCRDGNNNACGICTTKCEDVTETFPGINLHNDTEQTQEEQQNQQKTNTSDYIFDYKFLGNESVLHPNWTEAEAQQFCLRKLVEMSPVVTECLKVPGFEHQGQIDWCAQDIALTGDVNWADTHLEALKINCEQSINANVDFYSNEEGANITKSIYNLICTNECSGNGECKKGVCVCRGGFSGQDCSVELDQRPEVYQLPNGGVCDTIGTRTCQNSYVTGDKFAGDEYCHVTSANMVEQLPAEESTIVSKASILTSQQLFCGIPVSTTAVQSHTIRLSYSESSEMSTPLVYVTFNSICHDCQIMENSVVKCSRKNTGCVIDGVCYAEGASKPDDECMRCSNGDNEDEWSRMKTLRCRLHLVYIVVGAIAALIIIVCITVCVCYACSKKEEAPPSNYSSAPRSLSVVYVSNCSEPSSPVKIGSGFRPGSNFPESRSPDIVF
ncbi:hypothetical protein CAPTEDRAFT_209896 [Capitella teleta]|uniref:VWFD domain-containing protein n=1 Tax=Capitella teleta TaxID=283909 RepID=R7UVD1_CAPTE|nr:hypothetical protein CAPTEDRAFT_209896 [Capitella teleta]|eukprot:ELU07922.1 hypothetical protein CAPTEDRAFT_209896 [Capitella teleta]